MLNISPELALAFERDTLTRWKGEIADRLAGRFSDRAQAMGRAALEDWVREAIEMLRDQGGTLWADVSFFSETLFALTEGAPDARALGDFTAIMAGPGDLKARLALLRKAFPAP